MYLKSLEVYNFKSFKGEATIPLDRGFTAITGPNGSGKSNCGDAIQFVLGPKSNRVIRAQNSTDLIFNGGKNSKPARECSATLVFANPVMNNGRRRLPLDKEEIRMSRKVRLTASNNVSTSYMLNGEESTQKAFHRLLGAANARPDGYNIVLQGDVTSLAKMTANERRKVLDNVAGVTSYDDEIRKATKQQEKVEGYIERIGLLEKEQLDRLATLEKEKALAEKAREVTEEIQRSNELLLQSRYASMKNELEFHIGQREQSLSASQTLMDEHKEQEKKLLQLDDRISELQKEINALTGGETSELGRAIRELQVRIELNNDRIAESERENGEEQTELESMSEQWNDAKSELAAFQDELKTANDDLASALEDLAEAEKEEGDIKIALESAGEKNQDLSRALSKANEKVEKKKTALDSAQSDVDRLALEAELVGEQLAIAQDEAEEMRLSLGECDLRKQELDDQAPEYDREALAGALIQSQRTEQQLSEDTGRIENKFRDAERRLSRAKAEMEEKTGAKGLAGGASAVIAARDRGELTGIIGTIAELCAPKDDAHETALATAIGAGMASVVVDTDEDAARAIRWLAETRSGRATFLPLNKLANSRPAGKSIFVARKEGVIGFAHEMLDYDPRIDIAVRFVLRSTLLVDSMATARKHMGGIRLVTLGGNLTEAGGAMVGGSRRKLNITFGGRIQGASEVEKCTAEVEKYRLMSETVSKALREARLRQQELRTQINALVDDSHATSLRELKAERKQLQATYSKGLGVVKGLDEKLSLLRTNAQDSLKSLDEAQRQHAEATEEGEIAQNALEAASPEHLRERMNAAKLKRVEATGIKERAEGYLASGSASMNLLQRRVDESKERIDRLEANRITRSERIDTLSA
ncbi:MAG TPA: AAA family ATPase, partial [Poseidonia sp.]|nr:AAA family ATPase [Poseidonia sp.]